MRSGALADDARGSTGLGCGNTKGTMTEHDGRTTIAPEAIDKARTEIAALRNDLDAIAADVSLRFSPAEFQQLWDKLGYAAEQLFRLRHNLAEEFTATQQATSPYRENLNPAGFN